MTPTVTVFAAPYTPSILTPQTTEYYVFDRVTNFFDSIGSFLGETAFNFTQGIHNIGLNFNYFTTGQTQDGGSSSAASFGGMTYGLVEGGSGYGTIGVGAKSAYGTIGPVSFAIVDGGLGYGKGGGYGAAPEFGTMVMMIIILAMIPTLFVARTKLGGVLK